MSLIQWAVTLGAASLTLGLAYDIAAALLRERRRK